MPTQCIELENVQNLFERSWQSIYCDIYTLLDNCAYHVVAVSGDTAVVTRNDNDNMIRFFSKESRSFKLVSEYSIAYRPKVVEIFRHYVLVGSPWEEMAVVRVYEKNHTTGMWNQTDIIVPNNSNDTSYFGSSIDIYKDMMVVGGSKAFFVFQYNRQSHWVQESILIPNGTVFNPVASIWEDSIAVSGYCTSETEGCPGEVSLYDLDSSKDVWVLKNTIKNVDCPGWFGASGLLFTSDGGLLIGCYIGNNIDASVYYYTKQSDMDQYVFQQKLSVASGADPNPRKFSGKYTKMSLDGNVLLVAQGVSELDSTAFLFELKNDIWTVVETITTPFPNFVSLCLLVRSMQRFVL